MTFSSFGALDELADRHRRAFSAEGPARALSEARHTCSAGTGKEFAMLQAPGEVGRR